MVDTAPSITISKQVNSKLDDILVGIAELETPVLEDFMQRLGHLIARRKVKSLPEREAELLAKINKAIPVKQQKMYESLLKKNREETITPLEHEELLTLIEKIEVKNAERLGHLFELSRLREVPLNDLMKQLHLYSADND
jgi:hypothetical protein